MMPVKLQGQPPQEMLDDLCSRFILNATREDLESFERLLFVVEQAHWFYEDSVRDKHPKLKSYNLREFTVLLFQSCAALKPYKAQVHQIYDQFNAYKVKVPVAGAVILDRSLQYCLLVRGWKANSTWGFPKGKKSKDEEDSTCAAREVLEETGFDIAPLMDPSQALEKQAGDRRCRLFLVPGVDMRTARMQPQTKKEISEIGWHALADLIAAKAEGLPPVASRAVSGARLYLVHPFMREIVNWVAAHHTAASRALAAQSPAARGVIVSCWKARGEEGPATVPTASSQQRQAYPQSTPSTTASGDTSAGMPSMSATQQVSLPAQTFDAQGRPLFLSLRNFHFDPRPIMEALHG